MIGYFIRTKIFNSKKFFSYNERESCRYCKEIRWEKHLPKPKSPRSVSSRQLTLLEKRVGARFTYPRIESVFEENGVFWKLKVSPVNLDQLLHTFFSFRRNSEFEFYLEKSSANSFKNLLQDMDWRTLVSASPVIFLELLIISRIYTPNK